MIAAVIVTLSNIARAFLAYGKCQSSRAVSARCRKSLLPLKHCKTDTIRYFRGIIAENYYLHLIISRHFVLKLTAARSRMPLPVLSVFRCRACARGCPLQWLELHGPLAPAASVTPQAALSRGQLLLQMRLPAKETGRCLQHLPQPN